MLGDYSTPAEVGAILGVSEERVLDEIVNGPLVAVRREAGLMVHEEDLAAYRRPRATSGNKLTVAGSNLLHSENAESVQGAICDPSQRLADYQPLRVASAERVEELKKNAAGRNTMASAGFRALRDNRAVRAASDRFDRLVSPDPNSGCFIWAGAMDRKSYGYFRLTSAVCIFSHRYAWVRANGAIEERLEVDHLCHQCWCVNPAHLEAVSKVENLRRRDARLAKLGTDNCAIARATVAARRHLHVVRP